MSLILINVIIGVARYRQLKTNTDPRDTLHRIFLKMGIASRLFFYWFLVAKQPIKKKRLLPLFSIPFCRGFTSKQTTELIFFYIGRIFSLVLF